MITDPAMTVGELINRLVEVGNMDLPVMCFGNGELRDVKDDYGMSVILKK